MREVSGLGRFRVVDPIMIGAPPLSGRTTIALSDWRTLDQAAPTTVPPAGATYVQAFNNARGAGYTAGTQGKTAILKFARATPQQSDVRQWRLCDSLNLSAQISNNLRDAYDGGVLHGFAVLCKVDNVDTSQRYVGASVNGTVRLREIVSDFDPSTMTWNSFYSSPPTFGNTVEGEFFGSDEVFGNQFRVGVPNTNWPGQGAYVARFLTPMLSWGLDIDGGAFGVAIDIKYDIAFAESQNSDASAAAMQMMMSPHPMQLSLFPF